MTVLYLLAAVTVLGMAGGFAFARWRDTRARSAVVAVQRGRGLTVPMMVSVAGSTRRTRGVVDGPALRVIGPRTHLVLDGRSWADARQRRLQADEDLLETSLQRGYVDAAGTTYLLGAYEDWEDALTAALARDSRPAGRWRVWLAAAPRVLVAAGAAAALCLVAVQVIWASGHDVTATMVGVVVEDGVQSCAVGWEDDNGSEYAEVDCSEPFPAVGAAVPVHALAWPFEGSAMDVEGSYDALVIVFGGLLVGLAVGSAGVVATRVRRGPVRLVPVEAPRIAWQDCEPARVDVRAADSTLALLTALSAVEGWQDGVGPAPEQRWYAPVSIALFAARWWPAAALAGAAWLLDDLPDAVRRGLGVAAVALLVWAAYVALSTWFEVRGAYRDPVTSEWEYHLFRTVTDEWAALLLLGDRPHWMVELGDGGHPAVGGSCGVRGDLRDGGAVQLRIDGGYWMAAAPVSRVDEDLLSDLREELVERLADLGGRGEPGTPHPPLG